MFLVVAYDSDPLLEMKIGLLIGLIVGLFIQKIAGRIKAYRHKQKQKKHEKSLQQYFAEETNRKRI